jgi:hypothetical protein
MKRFNSIVFALTAGCAFAISSYATDTILVNDTWADGNRTSSGPDGGGIDSPWYATTGTALSGTMVATLPSTSFTFLTYFAPDATPVNLAAAGDELKLTWTFTATGINANNTSQTFNFAVVDTPTAALVSADNFTTASAVYNGYAMFSNMGRTLGNGNPFWLKKWGGTSTDFLGHQGNWTGLASGGTSGNTGYANNVSYTYVFDAVRDSSGDLIINSTMTGGNLNGVGFMTASATDTTPATYTFDTFAVRPSSSSNTAQVMTTTLFEAEFIVPEPSTLVLAGLGLLGLVGYRRLRR